MDLSIVTTMYCSAPHLKEFYERSTAAARSITEQYEIIFVNDGSPDDSLSTALSLYETDARIKILDLSRNFGHHKALMTGMAHASGELVFLIDSDLEEEPELLIKFHREMRTSGADVVYGIQETRKGGFWERASGSLYYWLFDYLSDCPVPANALTARLMSRRYVMSLVQHQDREVFLLGLWAITGFTQVPCVVTKHSRGKSTYTLRRKIAVLVNSITSFSNKPLILIFYLGSTISLVAGLAALHLIVRRVFFGTLLQGWPSLMVSIWLLGGLIIFSLGVIGIYLAKVFSETKPRPYTIVRQIYSRM